MERLKPVVNSDETYTKTVITIRLDPQEQYNR